MISSQRYEFTLYLCNCVRIQYKIIWKKIYVYLFHNSGTMKIVHKCLMRVNAGNHKWWSQPQRGASLFRICSCSLRQKVIYILYIYILSKMVFSTTKQIRFLNLTFTPRTYTNTLVDNCSNNCKRSMKEYHNGSWE